MNFYFLKKFLEIRKRIVKLRISKCAVWGPFLCTWVPFCAVGVPFCAVGVPFCALLFDRTY